MRSTTRSSRLAIASLAVAIATSTVAVGAVAAPAAAAPTPASATASSGQYVVQPNDTLFDIARRMKVSLSSLLATNSLTADSMIHPGMVILVPAGAVAPPATASVAAASTASTTPGAAAGSYVVQRNDSIFSIAKQHGLKMGPLMKANRLTIDSMLVPGRMLTIPAGGTLVASPAPAAPGQATPPAAAPATEDPGVQPKIDAVVAYAKAQLGKPWKFASAGPDSFDCSGLTLMAYQQIGIDLPHQSALQANRGVAVDWYTQDIQAGDLIFMATSDAPGSIGHVGVAIDSKRWIHSPRAGDVVRQGFIPADARLLAVRRYVTG